MKLRLFAFIHSFTHSLLSLASCNFHCKTFCPLKSFGFRNLWPEFVWNEGKFEMNLRQPKFSQLSNHQAMGKQKKKIGERWRNHQATSFSDTSILLFSVLYSCQPTTIEWKLSEPTHKNVKRLDCIINIHLQQNEWHWMSVCSEVQGMLNLSYENFYAPFP